MAVPNVNQHYDCIVIKKWNGVKTAKADIEASVKDAGDVIFFANGQGEGRFIYRDNDSLKSSVLFGADVFSKYKSHTRIAANRTKYQRKTVVIVPKDNIFAGGKVQSNDVAMINLTIKNFLVLGDLNTYMTEGYVQLNTAMTKKEMLFYLAKSLIKNKSRAENLGIKVYLGTASNAAATGFTDGIDEATILAAKTAAGLTGDYDCIAIQEDEMKWELGRFYSERPSFDVTTNLIEVGIAMPTEMAWAEDVTDYVYTDRGNVPNGRAVAEVEYFSQAQRGDKWLKGGWPYTFHADGLVDPTKEYDIAVIDATYRGDAEDIQISPKQLYLVMEKATSAGAPLTAIITAITPYLK